MLSLFKRKPDPRIVALTERVSQLESRLWLDVNLLRESTDTQLAELADVSVDQTKKIDALSARVTKAELAASGKAMCTKCERTMPVTSLIGGLCHPCGKAA